MKIIEVGAFFSYSYTNLAEVTLPVPQAAARSIVGPARAADDRVAPAVVAEAAPAVVAIPVNGPVVVEGASPVAVVAACNSFFFLAAPVPDVVFASPSVAASELQLSAGRSSTLHHNLNEPTTTDQQI